ncbi:DUF6266 family protein [Parapedobacter sp. DT-150]|uniref:DUF6266 family protein n=1 Tax=Parapedobacter sp. DT-150 TaxID=3396162 RepID=UPI003F1CCD64
MGKLTDGIHGHVHGKVGGVVFYTANGQNIARSLPRATRKKRKPTALQALQRERFKVMQDWLRPLLRVVKVGFGKYAPPRTGHNAAMSYNLTHAVVYNEEASRYEVNPEAFAFSGGPLAAPLNASAVQDGNTVRFSWENPGGRDIRYTTRTMLLLCKPGSGTCHYKTYGNAAGVGMDTLDVRGYYLPGDTCHAYMAFIDEETGAVSDSVYAGSFVLGDFEA